VGRSRFWSAAVALVPAFVHSDYVLNLCGVAGIYAIVVMGLGILLGFTGQMSLAQAAFSGSAPTRRVVHGEPGWPVWPAMGLAVVLSALVGSQLAIRVCGCRVTTSRLRRSASGSSPNWC